MESDLLLINLSNHPACQWPAGQAAAAQVYGRLIDLPFPDVNPDGDEQYIATLAGEYLHKVQVLTPAGTTATVHLMGEMNFTYALVRLLRQCGIQCIASTTRRVVEILPDGRKAVGFEFVKFRRYE